MGSLPAPGGNSAKMTAGALTVLNSKGKVVKTLKREGHQRSLGHDGRHARNTATLFVTNVLNGTVKAAGKTVHKGTVIRIGLKLSSSTATMTSKKVIATGFGEHTDPAPSW